MVILTPGAIRALEQAAQNPLELLHDHQYGVWGGSDHEEKFMAVQLGLRVFSAHMLSNGTKLWIVTEGTRASTMILLPSEF